MNPVQKFTEAETLAFKKTFPQHFRFLESCPDGIPDMLARFNTDENKVAHISDLQRRRKSLIADMRALVELAEKEKREFDPVEKNCFSAIDKLTGNIDYAIDTIESRHSPMFPGTGTVTSYPGDGLKPNNGPAKIFFRSDEKIADARPAPNEQRGLTIGRYMQLLATGGANNEMERRALSEGVSGQGGYTVPVHLMAMLIDKMREKSVCSQAGMTTILLNTEKSSIARLESDPVPTWRVEAVDVTESSPAFGQVNLQARSVACMIIASRELLQDSLNVEQALSDALIKAMAVEVDRVCLLGSGTAPEPRGIASTSGILTHSVGGANGGQLAGYAPIVTALQKLADANSAQATGIIMAPRTRYGLESLVDTTNQPLNAPAIFKKIPMLDTTGIPVNMAKGTANNATKIITGDFSQLLLGMRQELMIEVDRVTLLGKLQVKFVAHMRLDVAVAHPESFCVIDGIIP